MGITIEGTYDDSQLDPCEHPSLTVTVVEPGRGTAVCKLCGDEITVTWEVSDACD